jgi:exodeoxyribonuclease-3
MKIYSWNVNGIRAVAEKGFLDWLEDEKPDILCLQEIKANEEDLDRELTKIDGYYFYCNSAQKKGYSGTAVYTKVKPLKIETKIGLGRFDSEGRVQKIEFDDFILFNLYIPNGGVKDKKDIPYKIEVFQKLFKNLTELENKKIILVGDFNIAHEEIDNANAERQYDRTTFTKTERDILTELLEMNYTDTFRKMYPETIKYSCWDYSANQRMLNIGWRYDYVFVSNNLLDKVKNAFIEKDVMGSDHCPVGINLESKMDLSSGPTHPKDTLF